MAKRRRLGPAQMTDVGTGASQGLSGPPSGAGRPPIADVAGEASVMAAMSEMEQTLREAREEGLLIQKLSVGSIDDRYLVRDRVAVDPEETRALMESLSARGQQVPIEVADLGAGRYGLISGWRRLLALRTLGIDTVLAVLRKPAESSDAYLAMVEENEIRVGLSFYERGRISAKAADMGVYPSDLEAVKGLFPTAPRSRRSKIGSFVRIVRALDEALQFPAAFTETTGLALAKKLDTYPALSGAIATALASKPPQIAEQEQAVIAEAVAQVEQSSVARRADPAKGGRPKKPPPIEVVLRDGLTAQVYMDGKIVLTGSDLSTEAGREAVLDLLR